MSGPQIAEAEVIRAVLHEVWLRIHVTRFDDAQPDSLYNGVTRSERIVETYAREHGIPDIRSNGGTA